MTIDKTKLGEEFIIQQDEYDFYKNIGATIKNARTKRNITQQQVADLLGIDTELVDAFENATLAIPVYHFFNLAKYLNWPEEFNEIQKFA